MVIDLDEKTVRFVAGETLTLDQLVNLVEFLDDTVYTEAQPEPTGWVYPRKIFTVESETWLKFYATVYLEDDTWACSCPDWIYRRSGIDPRSSSSYCKHIRRCMWHV